MIQYVKDPLNYVGGKFKLLPQILPLFPERYNLFVDLFGGSGVVSVNQECKNIIYNDKLYELTKIIKWFKSHPSEYLLDSINNIIQKYNLSKTNKEGYLQLRKDYNSLRQENKFCPEMLYCLIVHAFNYQIGFNSKNEFNLPFGNNRSSFNKNIRERFPIYIEKLQSKNIKIFNNSFENIIYSIIKTFKDKSNNILFYIDPPYLSSDDSYSRTKYLKWDEDKESLLYDCLDLLNDNGFKFALSNVFNNNNIKNNILQNWAMKYNVKYLDISYSNSNYQKNRESTNKEVLVINY